MKVKFEGGLAIEAALGEISRAAGRRIVGEVLKSAALPIAVGYEAGVGQDSGHLHAVIDVAAKLTGRQRKAAGGGAQFAGLAGGKATFRAAKSDVVEVHVGPTTDAENRAAPDPAGLFEEFGTADRPANPALTRAWEQNKAPALEQIGRELGGRVMKAAARARKR